MNKKIFIGIFIILIIGVAIGGAVVFLRPYNPTTPPTTDDTGNTPEGIFAIVSGNNRFAIDIYKELVKNKELLGDTDLFFSPYSISSAIAMTYEGADGTTAEEIKNVFYFPETDILRPNFAAIYNIINKEEKQYELRTGNALWANKDYKFLESYFSNVEKYYGGKAVNLDFAKEPELCRNTINKFIEEQTNNRIKELIAKGQITSNTKLILTNAVYFLGKWDLEFDKKDTFEKEFKTPTETKLVSTMTMVPKDNLNYYEDETLQILELPYKNKELSMIVFLPKEMQGINSLENEMDFTKLNIWIDKLKSTKVDRIYFPKLEFETNVISLVEPLKKLGMKSAFSTYANFSKMDGTQSLFISEVLHKAFIKVDEEGTEAAAATAVIMDMKANFPSNSTIFNADHPFLFLIKENETGLILFMGRITDPSS